MSRRPTILDYAPPQKRSVLPPLVAASLAIIETLAVFVALLATVIQICLMPWDGGVLPVTVVAAIISVNVGRLRAKRNGRPGKPRSLLWPMVWWAMIVILPAVVYQFRGRPPSPPPDTRHHHFLTDDTP